MVAMNIPYQDEKTLLEREMTQSPDAFFSFTLSIFKGGNRCAFKS